VRRQLTTIVHRVRTCSHTLCYDAVPGFFQSRAGSGKLGVMRNAPLLQKVDAVTLRVPDLDSGLRFYRDALVHELRWRHDGIGAAGLGLPGSDTEIVLSARLGYEPNWPG
jgi:hypothetical protein